MQSNHTDLAIYQTDSYKDVRVWCTAHLLDIPAVLASCLVHCRYTQTSTRILISSDRFGVRTTGFHPGSGCSRPGCCVPSSNWLIFYFTYSSPARCVLPSLADFAAAEAVKLRPCRGPSPRPGPARPCTTQYLPICVSIRACARELTKTDGNDHSTAIAVSGQICFSDL